MLGAILITAIILITAWEIIRFLICSTLSKRNKQVEANDKTVESNDRTKEHWVKSFVRCDKCIWRLMYYDENYVGNKEYGHRKCLHCGFEGIEK